MTDQEGPKGILLDDETIVIVTKALELQTRKQWPVRQVIVLIGLCGGLVTAEDRAKVAEFFEKHKGQTCTCTPERKH